MNLITLLKMGCSVYFPSGYVLKGDPQNNYIETFINYGEGPMEADGLRILDKEGLKEALKDAKHFEKQTHE